MLIQCDMEASAAKQTTTDASSSSASAGVLEDFEAFIEKFTATQSVRYEQFAEVWKELQMSLIFAGRQSDQECREFTEECLQLALSYCSSSHPFQVRVWALYMLYAIYFKHPFHLRVKVRVTLAEWRELLNLIAEIHQQEHLDAEYVFTRLRYDHAFYFVATKTEMYPGARPQIIDADSQQQKLDLLMEEKSIVSQLFEPDTIDQLSAIHEEYQHVKSGLSGHTSSVQQSLNVIENALVQFVTKAIAGHEAWRKTKVGKKLCSRRRREDGTGGQSTSESEAESDLEQSNAPRTSIASIRAEIKSRAYSSNTGSRRYRRRPSAVAKQQSAMTTVTGPSSTAADGDVGTPHVSVGVDSMPLIDSTGGKAGKLAVEDRKRKRSRVGRPCDPAAKSQGKRKSSAAAARTSVEADDDDDKEEDQVHRKKRRRKKTSAAAAAAVVDVDVVDDEPARAGPGRSKKMKKKKKTTAA